MWLFSEDQGTDGSQSSTKPMGIWPPKTPKAGRQRCSVEGNAKTFREAGTLTSEKELHGTKTRKKAILALSEDLKGYVGGEAMKAGRRSVGKLQRVVSRHHRFRKHRGRKRRILYVVFGRTPRLGITQERNASLNDKLWNWFLSDDIKRKNILNDWDAVLATAMSG